MQRRILLVAPVGALLSGCDQVARLVDSYELAQAGRGYKRELVGLIRRSKRVLVTEHAAPLESEKSHPTIYRSVELSESQRASLVDMVEAVEPDVGRGEPMCIYEPHHSFYFHLENAVPRSLEVCFGCRQLYLSGTRSKAPVELAGALEKFILSIGLSPNRDWKSLAKEGVR